MTYYAEITLVSRVEILKLSTTLNLKQSTNSVADMVSYTLHFKHKIKKKASTDCGERSVHN